MKGPRWNLTRNCERARQGTISQTSQGQISARDSSGTSMQGQACRDSLRLGVQFGSPTHSLFTGAQGWPVLHLVQLVYFVLLQREPNKTRDMGRLEPHSLM